MLPLRPMISTLDDKLIHFLDDINPAIPSELVTGEVPPERHKFTIHRSEPTKWERQLWADRAKRQEKTNH